MATNHHGYTFFLFTIFLLRHRHPCDRSGRSLRSSRHRFVTFIREMHICIIPCASVIRLTTLWLQLNFRIRKVFYITAVTETGRGMRAAAVAAPCPVLMSFIQILYASLRHAESMFHIVVSNCSRR